MLNIFSFKQLAVVLVFAVMAMAVIGSAAALSYSDTDLHVVQGAETWTTDTVGVDYAIGSSGEVTTTLTFGASYTDVSFSHDNGGTYDACSGSGTSWECVMTSAEANSSTGIDVVAANEN